jgi:L-alanine-DL-glutamate epimerase-like enolase superfamily enzyme
VGGGGGNPAADPAAGRRHALRRRDRFLRAAALAAAHCLELSAHCAPSLHAHACAAVMPLRNLEYFHDHVRIEHLLFDGALSPVDGALHPDPSRLGFGLELKRADAEKYAD